MEMVSKKQYRISPGNHVILLQNQYFASRGEIFEYV